MLNVYLASTSKFIPCSRSVLAQVGKPAMGQETFITILSHPSSISPPRLIALSFASLSLKSVRGGTEMTPMDSDSCNIARVPYGCGRWLYFYGVAWVGSSGTLLHPSSLSQWDVTSHNTWNTRVWLGFSFLQLCHCHKTMEYKKYMEASKVMFTYNLSYFGGWGTWTYEYKAIIHYDYTCE